MPGAGGGRQPGAGRKPATFKAFAASLATDPTFLAALKAKALEGDVSALKLVVQYAEGLPAQDVTHGGSVDVRVTFEDAA